jgi:cysteine desulfurase family protein
MGASAIYFDNAATSWPKPPAVRDALEAYFGFAGGNPGRSAHSMSVAAARVVAAARSALADLLGIVDPSRIALTRNATEALNLALYGLLKPGDHVVTTSMEHNSVMRPLRHLETQGVELTVVPCSPGGALDLDRVRRALRPTTRLLATIHGSNVTGALMPVEQLAKLAKARGIAYLLDASQTAGTIPIDVAALGIDLMAFPGHKGLLGPTGTGGLYIREGLDIDPLMRGGTGSDSALEWQPAFMPDRYESGTPNVLGLAGLAAGVGFLLSHGVARVAAHEHALRARFCAGATSIPGLRLYGPEVGVAACGVVSFTIDGLIPSEISMLLDQSFSILARPGLHCAPAAHQTLGTFPTGTVRFGFGWANTEAEIDQALDALEEIAVWCRHQPAGQVRDAE